MGWVHDLAFTKLVSFCLREKKGKKTIMDSKKMFLEQFI